MTYLKKTLLLFFQTSRIYNIAKPFYSGIGHILMFHRVHTENNHTITKDLIVSPEYLERIINYFISRDIDIISLDELDKYITGKIKKRFVIFTFDDGYLDNLTHALPVFKKYNCPFTMYLITDYPDRKCILWWYLLEKLVIKEKKVEFTFEDSNHTFRTTTDDEKVSAFRSIRRFILQSTRENLLHKLEAIFHWYEYDLTEPTKNLTLNWEQVIEMSKSPVVTIGTHTKGHLALNMLSENSIRDEIIGSVKKIESRINKPVSHMAYPFGSKNEVGIREFNITATCGIKTSCTTRSGNIFPDHIRYLHALPRIDMRESFNERNLDLYLSGFTPFLKNHFSRIITS